MRLNARKKSGKSVVTGPGLWDECLPEKGVQLLAELNFTGAAGVFENCLANQSLDAFNKQEPAAAASKAACDYWAPLIRPWQLPANKDALNSETFALLIDTYQNYDFGHWLSSFACNLLAFLCEQAKTLAQNLKKQMESFPDVLLQSLEKLPDLVLKLKKHPDPGKQLPDLLLTYSQSFPKEGKLAFLLAHAYLMNRQKKAAFQQYARCLLYFPKLAMEASNKGNLLTLPSPVVNLLKDHPPASAVIIGVMRGLFPLISISEADKPTFWDPVNSNGLNCYHAFYQAEKALQNAAPLKEVINYRRALFEADKQIAEKYMEYLKSDTRQIL